MLFVFHAGSSLAYILRPDLPVLDLHIVPIEKQPGQEEILLEQNEGNVCCCCCCSEPIS